MTQDEDNMDIVEFHRSVNIDMYKDCERFSELIECFNNGGHEKNKYEGLIKDINIVCKKKGWQLELVKAREEKNRTYYLIKQKKL